MITLSQYRTGTVTLASGEAVVIGQGTTFLSNVQAGDLFKKQNQNSIYEVGSVDSNTQITLTSKYVGSGESGVTYSITRDFTPNMSLPEISSGDRDWPYLLTRALRLIDTLAPTQQSTSVTMVSGEITVSGTYSIRHIVVDTSGGAAEDLTKIKGGNANEIMYLSSNNASRVPTIKANTNIKMGSDCALDSVYDILTLRCVEENVWQEVTRANNA